jgi:chorismate synthase
MGIQAIKGVEVGDGFDRAAAAAPRRTTRSSATPAAAPAHRPAGGIEGGMTPASVCGCGPR